MEASRRSFLGGALALVGATALPGIAFASAPRIYGDGIRDDWAGLQALVDGRPFRVAGGGVIALHEGGVAILHRGIFALSQTLKISERATVTNCHFRALRGFRGFAMIEFPSSGSSRRMENCYLEASGVTSLTGILDTSFLGAKPPPATAL